jgi:Uncharacterized protein conserved in bacteria (DUF2147)
MRRHLATLFVMALLSLCLVARPVDAQEPSATGLWQQVDTESGKSDGWFLIYEPNPVCAKCTGDQQGAPWLGLTIIKGMVRKGLEYETGSILDPRYGQEWSALMHLSTDGQDLTVRGYLSVPWLGKDQYWKRLPDACFAQLDPAITAKFKLTPPRPGTPPPGAALPKGKPPAVCPVA